MWLCLSVKNTKVEETFSSLKDSQNRLLFKRFDGWWHWKAKTKQNKTKQKQRTFSFSISSSCFSICPSSPSSWFPNVNLSFLSMSRIVMYFFLIVSPEMIPIIKNLEKASMSPSLVISANVYLSFCLQIRSLYEGYEGKGFKVFKEIFLFLVHSLKLMSQKEVDGKNVPDYAVVSILFKRKWRKKI